MCAFFYFERWLVNRSTHIETYNLQCNIHTYNDLKKKKKKAKKK